MATANAEDKRIKALLELLEERLKDSGTETVFFSFVELRRHPELSDDMATEEAIKKICARSGGRISYREVRSGGVVVSNTNRGESTANTNFGQSSSPVYVPPKSTGYELLVLNPEKLRDSFKQLVSPLSFDPIKSRLYIRGEEIKIRKSTDQYHTLRIIFENPTDIAQEWFFSEIVERVDMRKPNEKTYYNAIHQIKIKLETAGFKDFFKTTTHSVQINPIYLS
jgi:hypothetical protein